MNTLISVKEIQKENIPQVIDYWMNASDDYLRSLGADPAKMPPAAGFEAMLSQQIATPYKDKKGFAMIWYVDNQAVGHNNINMISYGERANMHLHLWQPINRQKGIGTKLLKLSIPFFFEKFELQELYCEPYALNPAPNKTLPKLGFEFQKEYTTIPGSINFEQPVRQYKLSRERFEELYF